LIFSYFILKEKITKISAIGAVLIVIAIFVIVFFNEQTEPLFNMNGLLLLFIPIIIVEVILIFISWSKDYVLTGFLIGAAAGTMMALQTLFKDLTTFPEFGVSGAVFTVIFAILTLLVTQIGFTKAKASQVVPSFTSASIILTTFADVIALNQGIVFLQIIGIFIVIIGVILVSGFQI
jgi:drug/metabolite transporter (DMT)-like permease